MQNRWVSAAAAVVLGASLSAPAGATDYFVDNSCATGGSGTAQTCDTEDGPFRTIDAAFDASLGPGDTIRVKATGTPYSEPELNTPAAGTVAEPITLTSYAEAKPVWTGGSGTRLRIQHAYWIVDNFEFDGNGGNGDLIRVRGPNVVIRNCDLHSVVADGISVGQNADGLLIEGNHFHHLGGGGDKHGIVTGKESGDTRTYVLTDLNITGNTFEYIGGDGIQLYEESGDCRSATVTGRIADNTFFNGDAPGRENAIDVKVGARADDPMVIANNSIVGWDGSGTTQGGKPVVIQHCSDYVHFLDNVVDRGDGDGTCEFCFGVIYSASTASSSAPVLGIKIIGNTFIGMKRAIMLGEGSSNTAIHGIEVFNNTVYDMTDAMIRLDGPIIDGVFRNNLSSGSDVLQCGSGGGDLINASTSNNGWFGNSSDQDSCSGSCGSLCDSTDATGSDAGFADPDSNDFSLAPGSPAIDAGVDVGLPFAGDAPDLGSSESGAAPSGEPPEAPKNLKRIDTRPD